MLDNATATETMKFILTAISAETAHTRSTLQKIWHNSTLHPASIECAGRLHPGLRVSPASELHTPVLLFSGGENPLFYLYPFRTSANNAENRVTVKRFRVVEKTFEQAGLE
eukprot:586456-Rhodomonas_salina.2